MLFDENVQIRTWVLWIIFTVYAIEAFAIVLLLNAISSLPGIVYVVCVVLQSIALSCAMLWRLNHQAVLLEI